MKRLNRFYPLLVAGAFAAASFAPREALAVTENYCSFPASLSTSWTYNGNAFEALNSIIRLSNNIEAPETSSAFQTAPVTLVAGGQFHAYFRFQMTPNAKGGDGIAFVLHNAPTGAAALGTGAGGMGYGTLTPSVIVEFDTFKNTGGDPDANHVALMLNGSATTHTTYKDPGFTMTGGGILSAWVDYDPTGTGTLSVYIAQTQAKPATALFAYTPFNLTTQLGGTQAYIGFTAATNGVATADAGSEINEQDIYELDFSTDGIPCGCEGDAFCSGASGTPACINSGICGVCSATNATACTGATPVCDVAADKCVGCLTSATCSGHTPVCDGTSLACRACKANTDCSGATPVCDTLSGSPNLGECVACAADSSCPPTAPRCSLTTNSCVQCLSGADCGGDTPVCNGGLCKACASDTDCGGATPACEVWGACGQCSMGNESECTGTSGVCDFPTGTCVGCEFNSDCAGQTPTCNRTTHMCRACATNTDCVGNLGGPSCVLTGNKTGSCVICTQDGDCTSPAAPKCDTTANLCVQCLSSADCGATAPVCNSSNLCVQCLSDSDCSGATPICNTASSTCGACQNDYASSNPGQASCPSSAAPACQATGTSFAGQCLVCSASNNSLCVTQPTTPVCISASAVCGCGADTDCMASFYCSTGTAATGTCTLGCRVLNGTTNCATGEYCTATDGTVGTCMAEPCNSNADCKTAGVTVCNTITQPHVCVGCLNSSDCAADGGVAMICDSTTNHCAECTSTQTQNCTASGTGAACLANETCGCATDLDCGGTLSGRICDKSSNTCTAGCYGMNEINVRRRRPAAPRRPRPACASAEARRRRPRRRAARPRLRAAAARAAAGPWRNAPSNPRAAAAPSLATTPTCGRPPSPARSPLSR